MTSSVTTGFSPSSIANCVQWLDANDIGTLFQNSAGTTPVTAAGQSVAFWRDKSGNGNNVFQFSTIPVPTYSNVLIGNQPGLDFTNSSHLRSANFQNSSNITAFVVGMVKNTITGWGVFWGHFTTSDHDNFISMRNTSGQAVINWHTANDNSIMQMAYVLDSPVIYYGIMSNRFNTFFSQTTNVGTATVSGNVGGTTSSGLMPTFVGQSRIQSEAIRSYISEIIYYQRVLTTFEQQQVQGYLAWKYGLQANLPTTNPYRTSPYLMITETVPRSIPTGSFLVPINTFSTLKTITLPVVSTNPGRLLILKDYLGFASTNVIRLSTLGLDRIERSNISSMTLSNAYGAWTFTNDGRTNWFLTDVYTNSLTLVPYIPPVVIPLPSTANIIVDLRGTSYSAGGSTWINAIDSSTWSMSDTVYDATYGGPLFNGTTSFAYRNSVTNWAGLTTTIICYYYKSSIATDGQFITINRTGANITNQLFVNQGQAFDYSTNFGFNFTPTTSINTTGLFMFAFVKNGATGTFYSNASPNGTQTGGITVTVTNADFCIGKDFRDNNRFLAGTIKRYLIYNTALSAANISTVYGVLSTS